METGHAKNTANFKAMQIACAAFGAKYNPTDPAIAVGALATVYTTCDNLVKAVKAPYMAYDTADHDRHIFFIGIKHIARASFRALKSSPGVGQAAINNAQTLVDKITGDNIKKHRPHNPDDAANLHSVSQQSYDQILAHFNDLITVYTGSTYATNEVGLTIAELNTTAANALAMNQNINNLYIPYKQALKDRDIALYFDSPASLFNLAKRVKDYIRSNTQLSSTEKQLVTHLEFHRPPEDELHF